MNENVRQSLVQFETLNEQLLNDIVEAGTAAVHVREKGLHAVVKSTKEDIVTEGDTLVSGIIQQSLSRHFPEIVFLDEETAESHDLQIEHQELVGVIDPIDGTGNYFRGATEWGVSVGILKNAEVIAGVIYQPVKERLFYAEKDKGAFLNGEPIHVSATPNHPLRLIGSPPYEKDKKEFAANSRIKQRLAVETDIAVTSLSSQVIEVMEVARGEQDIFLHVKTKPWDIAAAISIVTEAGGVVHNAYGANYQLFEETIMLSGRSIPLDAVSTVVAEELPRD